MAEGWLAPSMVFAFIFRTEDIRGAVGKGQASRHVLSLQLQHEIQTSLEEASPSKDIQGFTGSSGSESVASQGLHWTRCQVGLHEKVPGGLAYHPGLRSRWDCSLLACLSPRLLLGLASACTWDTTPAPATKHT